MCLYLVCIIYIMQSVCLCWNRAMRTVQKQYAPLIEGTVELIIKCYAAVHYAMLLDSAAQVNHFLSHLLTQDFAGSVSCIAEQAIHISIYTLWNSYLPQVSSFKQYTTEHNSFLVNHMHIGSTWRSMKRGRMIHCVCCFTMYIYMYLWCSWCSCLGRRLRVQDWWPLCSNSSIPSPYPSFSLVGI